MKLNNSIYKIRLQMWRQGGDFVRKLSVALGAADPENIARMTTALPELFQKYDELATEAEREQMELTEGEQP